MSNAKVSTRGRADHSLDEKRAKVRKNRTPINGPRNILNPGVELDPSLHYCWVNDDDKGSVQKYLDAGYEFVMSSAEIGETTPDRPVDNTESVVWKNVGNGVVAYFMAIQKEWYEEDRAAENAERKAMMAEHYRQGTQFDGSYNPQAKVGGAVLEVEDPQK
jgi:hypothetical protein